MQRKRNYIAAILMMMLLVSLCHTTVFAAGQAMSCYMLFIMLKARSLKREPFRLPEQDITGAQTLL